MEQKRFNQDLTSIIHNLPNKPGIYQYYDKNQKIIYIGKAKNLKKRVSSYFTKNHDSYKLKILVRNIFDIKHIVLENESDALLLENNLIKKYQPKYNVQLKDDKSFPWICIKNENFPRIYLTRNLVDDGSDYYGPYTSAKMVRELINLTKQIFKIRTCAYQLSPQNIRAKKFKKCLEYHIGNCYAPCEELQSEVEYNESINNIKDILKGNINQVIFYLKDHMQELASSFRYEEAQIVKDKIDLLEKYRSKSTIVNPSIHDLEVYSIASDEKYGFVNYFKIINGAIMQAHTIEVSKKLDETDDEVLELAIFEIRNKLKSITREILLPSEVNFEIPGVKISIPKIGDKNKLVQLSLRNAKYSLIDKHKQDSEIKRSKEESKIKVLDQIQKDLQTTKLPVHIECFDNSNLQGSNPVAACVVFKNGKPSNKDYRHYNIKTVVGANDFASMEEVVFRRYRRLIDEGEDIPQVIVIDGGKGQLSSAYKSIKTLGLENDVTIIGIAKKLEEIFFPGDNIPLYLDKNSPTLKTIQHIRNEAHRFGITFHRDKRSKNFQKSELELIAGIGEKTIQLLYKHFKGYDNIKTASPEELVKLIGQKKTDLLIGYFSSEKQGLK